MNNTNSLDYLDEEDKFQEKHKLLKLNEEEIENINRPIKSNQKKLHR
jgi:hypothetical protein